MGLLFGVVSQGMALAAGLSVPEAGPGAPAVALEFSTLPAAAQQRVCAAQLSESQARRFTMARSACPSDPEPTAKKTIAEPQAASAHLRLFDALPASRTVGAVPQALRPTPRPRATPAASRAIALAPAIDAAARRHDIDPLLLHAIAHVESRHNPAARSRAGALGLMQVMPPTGRRFGVEQAQALHDAHTNLDVSARYLKVLQQRFGAELPLVLAAYNAGEGAVERSGRRIPRNRETPAYVREVLALYGRLVRTARTLSPAGASPTAAPSGSSLGR